MILNPAPQNKYKITPEQRAAGHLSLITGRPAHGKSTSLALFARTLRRQAKAQAEKARSQGGAGPEEESGEMVVASYFVNPTGGQDDPKVMLHSLCRQLKKCVIGDPLEPARLTAEIDDRRQHVDKHMRHTTPAKALNPRFELTGSTSKLWPNAP